jgi:hypothetical protein
MSAMPRKKIAIAVSECDRAIRPCGKTRWGLVDEFAAIGAQAPNPAVFAPEDQ